MSEVQATNTTDENPVKPPFVLNNGVYNNLKWIVTIILPSLGTLYFGLSQIWGLSHGEEVLGTVIVAQAFLGAVLGVSTNAYNNSGLKYSGVLNKIESEDKTLYSLELHHPVEDLDKKDEVTLKVNPASQSS